MTHFNLISCFNRTILLQLLVFVTASLACFITNCPPGGKRSGAETKVRQCEQCGPLGQHGRCYGSEICCSPEFGCLFGTPETFACQIENRFTTLCHNPGASCGGNKDTAGSINGQCAADGICCSSETCTLDDTCQSEMIPSILSNKDISLSTNMVAKKPQHFHEILAAMADNSAMPPAPLDVFVNRIMGNNLPLAVPLPLQPQLRRPNHGMPGLVHDY